MRYVDLVNLQESVHDLEFSLKHIFSCEEHIEETLEARGHIHTLFCKDAELENHITSTIWGFEPTSNQHIGTNVLIVGFCRLQSQWLQDIQEVHIGTF